MKNITKNLAQSRFKTKIMLGITLVILGHYNFGQNTSYTQTIMPQPSDSELYHLILTEQAVDTRFPGVGHKLNEATEQAPTHAQSAKELYKTIIAAWDTSNLYKEIQSLTAIINNHIVQDKIINMQQAMDIIQELMATEKTSQIKSALSYILLNLQNQMTPSQNQASVLDKNYIYSNQNTSAIATAHRLVAESYVSPKMQWDILSFYEKPFVIDKITRMPVLYTLDGQPIIDEITGKQQSMPTVEELLQHVQFINISSELKTRIIIALKTAIEAVNIAMFVAGVEAAYDENKQNYYFYQTANQEVIALLKIKKALLQEKLDVVKQLSTSGANKPFEYQAREIHSNKNHVMFSPQEIKDIIKLNDFTTLIVNRDNQDSLYKAANLLLKQCFIAQQQHLKDKARFEKLGKETKDIRNNLYIFEHFPKYQDLINLAKNMPTPAQKNMMLKHIRQAVQTALYIAKANSNYYITTDPFVQIFKNWDAELANLCIDLKYGATQDDLSRANLLANLTNIAAGAAVIGTAAAAYYGYQNPDQVKMVTDQISSVANQAYDYAKEKAHNVKGALTPKQQAPWEQFKRTDKPYVFGQGAQQTIESYTKASAIENGIPQEQSWTEWAKSFGPQDKSYIEKGYAQFNQFIDDTKNKFSSPIPAA